MAIESFIFILVSALSTCVCQLAVSEKSERKDKEK